MTIASTSAIASSRIVSCHSGSALAGLLPASRVGVVDRGVLGVGGGAAVAVEVTRRA